MKVKCLNGYFYFYPQKASEVSRFNSLFGQDLVNNGLFYTFSKLYDFPECSIKSETYKDITFSKTFAGKPEEIFKENKLCYNFLTKKIEVFPSGGKFLELNNAYGFKYYKGLIPCGSYESDYRKINGYHCNVSLSSLIFAYGEIFYE